MKNLKLFIILFSLLYANLCYSQSGWFWQNPNPSINSVHDITSTGGNTIYLPTENCGLFKSTDLGVSWLQGSCFSFNHYNSVQFINTTTGFATGNYTLVKTTDGGNNWQNISSVYNGFEKIYFLNNNTGFIINHVGTLYKTTNTGINWTTINTAGITIRDFFIFDTENILCAGILTGSCRILKTTNGGLNWAIFSGPMGTDLYDIYFADFNTGFAAGKDQNSNSHILKTTDGGNNWTGQSIPPAGRIVKIQCINNNTVYALASNGYFLASSNSGTNWNLTQFDLPNYTNMSMHFVNSSTGFIDGFRGRLFKTTNSGLNWSYITKGSKTSLRDIFFTDSLTGFAAGDSTVILKTSDAGRNWIAGSLNYNHKINSIYFLSNDTGFVVCDSGKIYKTINSGMNWSMVNLNVTTDLCKIKFVDNFTGIICGNNGFISRTTDKGVSWQTSPQFTISTIYSICYTNSYIAFVTAGNNVYKSTNTGLNWSLISSGLQVNNILDVSFANGDTGSVIGTYSGFPPNFYTKVYTTFNGGVNWNQTLSINGMIPGNIRYLSSKKAVITVEEQFYVTTNSGINWILKSNLPFSGLVNNIFFIDSNIGFVVGDNGMILKTTDGGGNSIVGVINSGINISNDFSLHQNYPNPFNPQTKIKFCIPLLRGVTAEGGRGVFVSLIIYDLLGREVTTLVNEELKPGTYEADWDGSDYSSGVYFYKLVVGDPSTGSGRGFVETKKMVLMK